MSHGPLLAGRNCRKSARLWVLEVHSIEVCVCIVSHFHLLSTFKSACPWFSAGYLLLDLSLARFSQDLHMDHGLPPASRRHGKMQDAVRWLYYLNLSSGVLNRTPSQIYGIWYLPVFLFRDGSFTLMNIASFIVLVRFCDFLPTMMELSVLEMCIMAYYLP